MTKPKRICERPPHRKLHSFSFHFLELPIGLSHFSTVLFKNNQTYLMDLHQSVSPILKADCFVLSILPSFSNYTLREKCSTKSWIVKTAEFKSLQ